MLVTEVRTGDAPKPQHFNENQLKIQKTSGNQPPVNHRNFSLFLSLHIGFLVKSGFGDHQCIHVDQTQK